MSAKQSIKKAVKAFLPKHLVHRLTFLLHWRAAGKPISKRHCNICDFYGNFYGFGRPMRLDARCPMCGSLERHRLLKLCLEEGNIEQLNQQDVDVLHFAAEPWLVPILRKKFKRYTTADLFEHADLKLDLEKIDIASESYDIIIANHVLEHVDDFKASKELSRILRKNGVLVCQVPIIEGWDVTYEPSMIKTHSDRWLHFGQGDHVRFYGKDFRNRIANGGFRLINEVTSEGPNAIKFGLLRGEKVFIFQKL